MSDEALLRELLEWAMDACHQGAGAPIEPGTAWHGFLSTWEDAEELLPRVADRLGLEIVTTHSVAHVSGLKIDRSHSELRGRL